MNWTIGIACLALGGIAGIALLWRPIRERLRVREAKRAIRAFRLQREHLEAKFFELATRRGKPRGLRWLECDWQDGVTFARDMKTGLMTAFVAVHVRFEAIEGGDMEQVEAVSMLRDAAALFHFQHDRWGTGGRALFNMNPRDALARLEGQYEPVVDDESTVVRS